MKKEIIQNNMENGLAANKVKSHAGDYYYDVFTLRQRPVSWGFKLKLAEDLVAWAQIDETGKESLRIQDFYNSRGISHQSYARWLDNCPALKEAHEFALSCIASRRELGALRKRYDAGSVFRSLGHYCKIERNEQERIASLKKDPEQKPTTFIVQMPSLDSSQLVPDKKNEHDENEQL